MKEHIIELAKDLMRIPSVSNDIEQLHIVIDRISQEFSEVSWNDWISVEKLESNGKPSLVIKNHEWNRSDLCMSVHVDVVPPSEDGQFIPADMEGKIFARWSSDMKSAASVAIFVMKWILVQWTTKKVSLLVTTDEEVGGKDGAWYLAELWYWGDVMLIPDTDNIDEIIIWEKWILTLEIEVTWTSWHSAYPWKASSAIERMINLYTELKESIEETHELSLEDHRGTSVQMTMCHAWTAINVIPWTATCTLSIRHTESYTETLLKNMCKHIALKNGWKIVSERYGVLIYTDEEDPIVQEYKNIAEEVMWRELKLTRTHGWTDGKKFADKWATIIMQWPTGDNMHTKNEWVNVESIETLYEVMWKYVNK